MADGTTKPIEDVKNGDEVLAQDPETGETSVQTVTAEITGTGIKHLVKITIDTDGDKGAKTATVTATEGHPFWVQELGKWIDAAELEEGQWLQTSAGGHVPITAVKRWKTSWATVHNLTVSDKHTYYVLAGTSPVLVHNALCGNHEVEVNVYDSEGEWKLGFCLRSGCQQADESNLTAHTENRASRMFGVPSSPNITNDRYQGILDQLDEGDSVVIAGQNHPCLRCRGAMNRLARQQGVNVVYTWPDGSGGTSWWQALRPWRFFNRLR